MNLQYLRENYPQLLKHMDENGYSKDYIKRLTREIIRILSATDKNWLSYTDIYLEYAENPPSQTALRRKRCLLGIIDHFDVRDQYPNGRRRHKIIEHSKYYQLTQEFKSIIDNYRMAEKKRGKKDSTIAGCTYSASSFFFDIQQNGIDTLTDVTEEAVIAAFMSPTGDFFRGYACKDDIAAVFRAYIPLQPEICNKLLSYLPALRAHRKNIQYLQPEEVTQIKNTLSDQTSHLSLRDRAIGTLALYTGLRRSDIAELTMDSISWTNDLICITQQKTNVPLELPLSATVGNAIYDYLLSGRPETESNHIFVSFHRPHERLNPASYYAISNNIMKAANIRQSFGSRKGFHIFRHRLATELLDNGIPRPIISSVLGQTSPDSLEAYLSADIKHLKECSLSIEKFPVAKEVFCNV